MRIKASLVVSHNRTAQPHLYRPSPAIPVGLTLLMVVLLLAVPVGADSGPVSALATELAPRVAEPGFAELVISKARGLRSLADSVTLISGLLAKSTRISNSRLLYVELASLQELLGRYEEAANSWEAAVAAQPGKGETIWLLSAAACRLAIGEAEAASALAKAALLTSATPRLIALAHLIEARALMLTGDLEGAHARIKDILDAGASGLEAAALSLARDVSSGAVREGYIKQLREKYPGRPEAQDASASIYSLIHFDPALVMGPGTSNPVSRAVSVSTPTAAQQRPNAEETSSSPLYYQLGAFRDDTNAALLSTRLIRAGFKPKTIKRESRTGVLYIVFLDAGPDPARLMITLKDAGFESWPLFVQP